MPRNTGWGEVASPRSYRAPRHGYDEDAEDMIIPRRRDSHRAPGHSQSRSDRYDDYDDRAGRMSSTRDRRRDYDEDNYKSASRSSSSKQSSSSSSSRHNNNNNNNRDDDDDYDYDDNRSSRSYNRSSRSKYGYQTRGGGYYDDDGVRPKRYSPEERASYSQSPAEQAREPRRRGSRDNRRPREGSDEENWDESYSSSSKSSRHKQYSFGNDAGNDYKPKRSNRAASPDDDHDDHQQQQQQHERRAMQEQKPRSRATRSEAPPAPAGANPRIRTRTITNTTTTSSSSDAPSPEPRSSRSDRTSDPGLDDDLVTAAATGGSTLASSSQALSASQVSLPISLAESDGQPAMPVKSAADNSSAIVAAVAAAVAAVAAAPAPAAAPGKGSGKFGLLSGESFFTNFVDVDAKELCSTIIPAGNLCLASITRSGTSIKKTNYFTMTMETVDKANNRDILYAKRQRHGKAISYIISTDKHALDQKSGYHKMVGKLKANVKKDKYVIYDDGDKKKDERSEICQLVYTAKSWSTPRGLMAKVPTGEAGSSRSATFVNALPEWDPVMKVHSLKFNGRATEISVKNFKLVRDGVGSQTSGGLGQQMYLRMGKVGKHTFNIDFRAPFSPLQAFGIALSSFEN